MRVLINNTQITQPRLAADSVPSPLKPGVSCNIHQSNMSDIQKLRMEKPFWTTDPARLDFKVINEPLEKVLNSIISKLERRARDKFSEFLFLAQKECYF